MSGPRAAKYKDLRFEPGFFTNDTPRGSPNRWKDGNWVRFDRGLPEKMGGYARIPLTGENSGIYTGVARALHDWASLDGQQWISIGTSCKLYLVNNAKLYDITPRRKSSTLTNPFGTTNGSPLVVVTDPNHRAEPGDHIRIFGGTAVGGLTLSGSYDVASVIGPNSYRINAGSNASSTATGGGDVSIEYDIACGLGSNGELLGYGTGLYGAGTYGTPRTAGQGIQTKLRTWSFDNWGEDLVASPSGGGLYWWDRTTGSNSRATLVQEAPSQIQRILVNPENRILIALGCTSLTGQPDKMLVRWCSQENFNDWTASTTNLAGGKRLDYGSEIITGIRSRGQNLIWTDTQLYGMEFVGAPFVFAFRPLGTCSIMGPNAAIDDNGIVYFMGVDDFFTYDGVLSPMPCDVHTYVFGDFDRTQADKVYCSTYRRKGEIRWEYPSESGTGENDRYVVFNRNLNCWYYGTITRTAYHDVSRAISGSMTNPYGVNNGRLYQHEQGTDDVDGVTTTVKAWFLESYDISIEGSDSFFLINSLVPDYDQISGAHNLYIKKKRRPQQAAYQTRGPYTVSGTIDFIDARARSSQMALRFENGLLAGQHFRMGKWQALATPYGGR